MMIEKGDLAYGVEYPAGSGKFHHAFEMRLPTIEDNVAALEEVGATSSLRMNVAMLARCLVSLGDVPQDAITTSLLMGMVDDDYDELAAARDSLKKKRKTASGISLTTESQSSSSVATASPSRQSVD